MKKRVQEYWQEIHAEWLTRAFPFDEVTFQQIIKDITENEYPPAEAIVKHIAQGSGIAVHEFARLVFERFQGNLSREDALAFGDAYGKLTMLLQIGFMLAVEGRHATEEILRQTASHNTPFLREHMDEAALLIKQDPTGRKMMMLCADKMTRTSPKRFFNEGALTACETFMAYSKCLEELFNRNVY